MTEAEQQRIRERNARLDALAEKLNQVATLELQRIDQQVTLLQRVREGRCVGKLKARADLHLQSLVVDRISDLLGDGA